MSSALIAFADGTHFWGKAFGKQGITFGEVVFNTGMTGYQEVLTDPSYQGQMVCFTTAHVGNTGINAYDSESPHVRAEACIVRNLSVFSDHYQQTLTLPDWALEQGMYGISDVDTRGLTHYLRDKGSQVACLMSGDNVDLEDALHRAKTANGLAKIALGPQTGRSSQPFLLQPVQPKPELSPLVVFDFGIKQGILDRLQALGASLWVVPANTSLEAVLSYQPKAIVLSNGPGDPKDCQGPIAVIRQLMDKKIPILGICLGHQLLALAGGAKTFKLAYGHHGLNHPVQDRRSGQVFITSQNHNFAVEAESLPSCFEVTHLSLFDGTIQGLRHQTGPILSFQGHPEAQPGPQDIAGLFEQFIALISAST